MRTTPTHEELRRARDAGGLSQKTVAQMLRVHLRTYQRYEEGSHPMDLSMWAYLKGLYERLPSPARRALGKARVTGQGPEGPVLKRVRTAYYADIPQCAEWLRVSESSWYAWEAGRRRIPQVKYAYWLELIESRWRADHPQAPTYGDGYWFVADSGQVRRSPWLRTTREPLQEHLEAIRAQGFVWPAEENCPTGESVRSA